MRYRIIKFSFFKMARVCNQKLVSGSKDKKFEDPCYNVFIFEDPCYNVY